MTVIGFHRNPRIRFSLTMFPVYNIYILTTANFNTRLRNHRNGTHFNKGLLYSMVWKADCISDHVNVNVVNNSYYKEFIPQLSPMYIYILFRRLTSQLNYMISNHQFVAWLASVLCKDCVCVCACVTTALTACGT